MRNRETQRALDQGAVSGCLEWTNDMPLPRHMVHYRQSEISGKKQNYD